MPLFVIGSFSFQVLPVNLGGACCLRDSMNYYKTQTHRTLRLHPRPCDFRCLRFRLPEKHHLNDYMSVLWAANHKIRNTWCLPLKCNNSTYTTRHTSRIWLLLALTWSLAGSRLWRPSLPVTVSWRHPTCLALGSQLMHFYFHKSIPWLFHIPCVPWLLWVHFTCISM